MMSKIKTLFFDRKRSEDEYKIVIRVLERIKRRDSLYLPLGDFKDQREFDYNDLYKIPDMYWSIKNQNAELITQLRDYQDRESKTSSVIDSILDAVEKRYELKKKEEHETEPEI